MQWKRYFLFGMTALIAVIFLLGVGTYAYFNTNLPPTGPVTLKAKPSIHIERIPETGIIQIQADSDADAFYALGYVHAQDRLWQMEMLRRVAEGRLSEVLGDATLETDQFLRTIGMHRAAQSAWQALSTQTQSDLKSYAAGVNAWLQEEPVLPPEFHVLGLTPEPWDVYDSLAIGKVLAWDMATHWYSDLLRARLIPHIGKAKTADLLFDDIHHYDEQDWTSYVSAEHLDSLAKADQWLRHNLHYRGEGIGSNNWVIHGSLTQSGMPLLANDPHLNIQLPSHWYLAEIQGHQIHSSGATIPGSPYVISGHNAQIAWGVTNMNPDVQDLYILKINPENTDQYKWDGQWKDFEIIEEPILVKGKDTPILWKARISVHGPVISDVYKKIPHPLAVRWTALDNSDATFDAFRKLNYASNWNAFKAALKSFVAPSLNFVYADTSGNIGYLAPGKVPIRTASTGVTPMPGWSSDYLWKSWIPYEDMPQSYNPPQGFLYSANEKPVDESYPYHLGEDFYPHYRAQRIQTLIRQMAMDTEQQLTIEHMQQIQMDVLSLQAQELLPSLLQATPQTPLQQQAFELLKEWDFRYTPNSAAALIYEGIMKHIKTTMMGDELPQEVFDDWQPRRYVMFYAKALSTPENEWCDKVTTPQQETCAQIILEALDAGIEEIAQTQGDDLSKWEWGQLHTAEYEHMPFSKVPGLSLLFHRSHPTQGSSETVNASYNFAGDYQQALGVSYRHIIDLSNWSQSAFISSTGQSGNVFSPYYDNFIPLCTQGMLQPMPWNSDTMVSLDTLRK